MSDEIKLRKQYEAEFEKWSEPGPWLATWGEDASFEILPRATAREEYVMERMEDQEGQYYLAFRGYPSFSAAKSYLLTAMRGWRDEIQLGIMQLKATRKPKGRFK